MSEVNPYMPVITFKAPAKIHLKMSSAEVVCCWFQQSHMKPTFGLKIFPLYNLNININTV